MKNKNKKQLHNFMRELNKLVVKYDIIFIQDAEPVNYVNDGFYIAVRGTDYYNDFFDLKECLKKGRYKVEEY